MSVFLSLVLSFLLLFNGTFIDVIRYDAFCSMAQRYVDSANISTFADFDGRLHDEYGVFVLYDTNAENIEEKVKEYIELNINPKYSGLFEAKLEKIDCNFQKLNVEELKKHIVEFSKVQVPKKLINSIITFIKDFIKNEGDLNKGIPKEKFSSDESGEDLDYNKEDVKFDKRKDNEKSVKELFESVDDENKEIDKSILKQLPSHDSDFNNLAPFFNPNKIDLENEKSTLEILNEGQDLLNLIKDSLSDIYDKVVVNEYIIGSFKSKVLKNFQGDNYKDLKGRPLANRETYLNNEVEYIINGKNSDKENLFMIKTKIFLIRFCFNSIYLYRNEKYVAIAKACAAAVTALFGGIGYNTLWNLILLGWSMGESCFDVSNLLKGKSVPLYKSQKSWNSDLDIDDLNDDNESKKEKILSLDYTDYLRLLLFTVPDEVKFTRIADLIQLNTRLWKRGFRIKDSICGVETSAIFSEKILFPIADILPNDILLTGKRRFLTNVKGTYQYFKKE